jgi:hypothetical protein
MFYGNKTRWRFSLCLSSHNQGFRYTSLNHCVPLATVPSEIPSALLDSEKEAVFPPRIELGVNFSRLFVGERKKRMARDAVACVASLVRFTIREQRVK